MRSWRSYILLCVLSLLGVLVLLALATTLPGSAQVTGYYTVAFRQQGTVVSRQKVPEGASIPMVPVGVTWLDDTGAVSDPAAYTVTGRLDFYTQDASFLTPRQVLYYPQPEPAFSPDETVTRGEMVAVICALLNDWVRRPEGAAPAFSDLTADSQDADVLAALNLLHGYGDGTFRPDQPMTRAELTNLLCRLNGAIVPTGSGSPFADVPAGHWAADSIALAAQRGWVEGCDDGLFYPEAPVTRAEALTMINRARAHEPNRAAVDTACVVSPYQDVSARHWAYYNIVDSAYENELLSYINGHAPQAAPGILFLGEQMCHVNADTLALDYYQAGFHTIDGDLYYIREDGYFIQRFSPGCQELEGGLYYVPQADGPFLTDGEDGYLYFGPDGRYTSGSPIIDAYVDRFVADIAPDASLSRYERLRAAYLKMRDGDYKFLGWDIFDRGSTDWYQPAAEFFFENGRGNCFNWAAAFMYVARRLGCQAYAVAGGEGRDNDLHAWEMILWSDGTEYLCDVELEWAFLNGHIDDQVLYYDLFMYPTDRLPRTYHFPE